MSVFQRPPKRTVPEPVKPPQHGATNPASLTSNDLSSFRWRILGITGGVLALAVALYAVYGPWYRVRTITVSGTREIVPASVRTVTEHELDRWRFGVIPNRNAWLLSRKALANNLEQKIRERISVEEVRIVKKNRHDLEVIVVERTPVALWKSGTNQGTIDKTGTIIHAVEEVASLPMIVNQGGQTFTTGEQVLTAPAMQGWKTLNDAFKVSTLIVEEYRIPVPTCPTKIVEPTEPQLINTNENATASLNDNTNNDNTSNTNSNSNGNGNTNSAGPMVVQTDCDLVALSKASQEIHVKLKDGPVVLFDRHQDLALAVQTVKRLLTDPDNSGATYIDIRFQERVYIK